MESEMDAATPGMSVDDSPDSNSDEDAFPPIHEKMSPVWVARSRFRRRQYDACIALCTQLLEKNPYDQAIWCLKCRAITKKDWLDDTEIEEEGIAELLLDDNALASMPRPGTSLIRPQGTASSRGGASALNQGVRPMTTAGRPVTGFLRPGSNSGRPGTRGNMVGAFQHGRPGTSRPISSSGRFIRLGTASLLAEETGMFVDVERLDLSKYGKRPGLARVLCDYLSYHEQNFRKSLELCSHATVSHDYTDWWWKARLGKSYYRLGLLRDAEKQFKSSLKDQEMPLTTLELCKVYLKLDQPNTALEYYQRASEKHPSEHNLILGMARVHDALNDLDKSVSLFKRVLQMDSSNIESIACMASHYFYNDQPEMALRYYRRVLQMGVNNTEIWNSLGLCCVHAGQYDMTLSCFERAIELADDSNMADVWYNVGQVAIGIGDLGIAYQTLKIAISIDPDHCESFNNLGVLELRKGNVNQARSNFMTAARLGAHMFEPYYNGALLAFKLGDFQESHEMLSGSLDAYPEHTDSKELLGLLKRHFAML